MAVSTVSVRVPSSPWKDEIGDIICPGRILIKCEYTHDLLNEFGPIGLTAISSNGWRALSLVGLDIDDIKEMFEYECPWTGNKHWHFMPWLLLTKNATQYTKTDDSLTNMAFDTRFVKMMWLGVYDPEDKPYDEHEPEEPEPEKVTVALLGHGYTNGTLPCDGGGDRKVVCIELDNGDLVAGWINVWYNK